MVKVFKYRIYPTEEQGYLMDKHFGCSRFVYNWALDKKIKAYQIDKMRITYFDLAKLLPALKLENPWLGESYSQCLQSAIRNLDNAFLLFFKKNNKFPCFKSKHKSKQTCHYPQGVKVDFENNKIKFPKIGEVSAILHRNFNGKVKTVTLSKTPTQKYFASILIDDASELPEKQLICEDTTLGIDVGLKHFATFSDGTKIENPKFLQNAEKRIAIFQKRMDRKPKTSKNRKDMKSIISRQYEKVTNKRKDFLHKLSHKLVCENQATMFVCEDLDIKGMMQNHKLAKSISDVAWSSFNTLISYKCDWYGKTYQQIGRFEPSSKICNVCGFVKHDLTLKDRSWNCMECNTIHDRDINASINIKKLGYFRSLGTRNEVKQSLSERLDVSSEL